MFDGVRASGGCKSIRDGKAMSTEASGTPDDITFLVPRLKMNGPFVIACLFIRQMLAIGRSGKDEKV